jgi:hypothetical protein
VAPLNPEHLFEQALKLTDPDAGRPRQADLRRAISTAYYGLFHAAVTAAADLVVGANNRSTSRYELVYRSADHKSLRSLCEDVSKQTMPAKFKPYAPPSGFGFDLKAFATAVVDLQEKRHAADYDPSLNVTRSEVRATVAASQTAFAHFESAPAEERVAFLSLLLFQPRQN